MDKCLAQKLEQLVWKTENRVGETAPSVKVPAACPQGAEFHPKKSCRKLRVWCPGCVIPSGEVGTSEYLGLTDQPA